MTRRRDCTCAGTAPGYPQHEDWCGLPERPYEPDDEPVEYLPAVELHLVPTSGGSEQRPSMYECMAANGVPEEYRTAATAGASEWMKIWLRPKAEWLRPPDDEPDPDGAA